MRLKNFVLVALVSMTLAITPACQPYDPTLPQSSPQGQIVRTLVQETVTVRCEDSSGTGVLVTRRSTTGELVTYVWTAGHVVMHAQISPDTFKNVKVIRRVVSQGKEVGATEYIARVIRWSPPEGGEDLALLEILQRDVLTQNTKFYLDRPLSEIGSELYHVGSMFGPAGADSVSTGIYSAYGRTMSNTYFDQTSVRAVPGCSGGGVFLRDGRCVGLAVRVIESTYSLNLIVPVRRMLEYARRTKCAWALDPAVPMPVNVYVQFDKAN